MGIFSKKDPEKAQLKATRKHYEKLAKEAKKDNGKKGKK